MEDSRISQAIENNESRLHILSVLRTVLAERLDKSSIRDTASLGKLLIDVDQLIRDIEDSKSTSLEEDKFNAIIQSLGRK